MNRTSQKRTAHQGRLFPYYKLSQEELANLQEEDDALYQQCRFIFERVKPELLKEHYNWFIVIEPISESYILNKDQEIAFEQARQQYPNQKLVAFRLNETGVCGRL
jgi:hypothetical protein